MKKYRGGGKMRRAIELIERRKKFVICRGCGEETSACLMSKKNPLYCKICYSDLDLDRFREYEPEEKEKAHDQAGATKK